jgi:hypothetical protein
MHRPTRSISKPLQLVVVGFVCGCGAASIATAEDEPEGPNEPPSLNAQEICTDHELRIEADLDTERFGLGFDLAGHSIFDAQCASMFFGGYDGLLHLRGGGPFDLDGSVPVSTAWLLTPSTGKNQPRWLCARGTTASISVPRLDGASDVRVTANWPVAKDVGSCPGEPLDGTVTLDWRSGEITMSSVSGVELGGFDSVGTLGLSPMGLAGQLADCGTIFLHWDTTSGGYLLTSDDASDPGALYCFGKATSVGDGLVEIADVSRLGGCDEAKPAAGAVALCYD